MSEYRAPVRDMQFVLHEMIGTGAILALPGCEDAGRDVQDAVLEQAARFANEVLAPLNVVGDQQGCRHAGEAVTTPAGWPAAYRAFCDAGWNGLGMSSEYGGQGLPKTLATAVSEMWDAANMAFSLCPLLTSGAIEALEQHGSDRLRALYLPPLIAGTWTGTMNLTEPQAGSDLSAVRTRAVPAGDHYLISGQKIFITYGEHDLAQNIVHLVLARLPDAPAGTRGISLFVVPKFVPDADGRLGRRNDLRCVSIEHKLGIHGSPTAVMSFGDQGGAVGWLVGEENRGLMHMFTMMNAARHAVGREGVGIAERAYQKALAHARERVQGQAPGAVERATIVEHPDVKRMLLTMKAQIEAMRALTAFCALEYERAERAPDMDARARAARRGDVLTPIVKGWCTETAQSIVSLGVQVHGGMGFIEETGAAQYLRDARITTIYEGTTGIQAGDLVGRKTQRDGGQAMRELLAEIEAGADALPRELAAMANALRAGCTALARLVGWICASRDARLPAAAATLYLEASGIVCGGWMMARAAQVAAARGTDGADAAFYRAKLATAEFYTRHLLPRAPALVDAALDSAAVIAEFDSAAL